MKQKLKYRDILDKNLLQRSLDLLPGGATVHLSAAPCANFMALYSKSCQSCINKELSREAVNTYAQVIYKFMK